MTIGTRGGATIEMVQKAGEENYFLFALAEEHWIEEHSAFAVTAALDSIIRSKKWRSTVQNYMLWKTCGMRPPEEQSDVKGLISNIVLVFAELGACSSFSDFIAMAAGDHYRS